MRTATISWDAATDSELLTAIRERDRHAFTALHCRMSRQLFAYVFRCIGDRAQAEEVLQEVFLEVWQNAARFDPTRAKASAWMHAIAHHKAVDRVRHAQRSRDREWRIGIRDYETVEHTAADLLEHDSSALQQALNTLTALQREAVMLRYFHDLSGAETARLLGVTVSAAKTRARDGLERLRRALHPEVSASGARPLRNRHVNRQLIRAASQQPGRARRARNI